MHLNKFDWIAIDWGTTNFRAWFIKEGKVLKEINKPHGIKNIPNNNFENILIKNIKLPKKINCKIKIISCGMIGSKQGWFDCGYEKKLNLKKNNLVKIKTKNKYLDFYIVKGLSQNNPYDVIRGEETQIIGYLQSNKKFSGFICLPGTHSKWVKITKGKLIKFKTYMTGELFEIISRNSILKHSFVDKKINTKTFKNSVLLSQKKNFNFFDYLFEFRSRTLLSKKKYNPKSELLAYLIGNEIKSNIINIKDSKVIIIGSHYNSKLYSHAMQVLKINNTIVESKNTTINGLKTLFNKFIT
jgi:2-dehydro-3-deoxygalactonokinase